MEICIYHQGQPGGTLQITQQGLYAEYKAACTFLPAEPLHLYAVRGFETEPIGVLTREGTLSKRFPLSQRRQTPDCVVTGTDECGYLPWRGSIDSETIAEAYLKCEGTHQALALPITDGGEVPLLAYAAQMEQATVCGRPCLILLLENGTPIQNQIPDTDAYTAEASAPTPEAAAQENRFPAPF